MVGSKTQDTDRGVARLRRGLVSFSEIGFRQVRFLFQRFLPTILRFILLAQALQDVAKVQERFGKLIALVQRLAIEPSRVVQLSGILQQESCVIEQFRATLAL